MKELLTPEEISRAAYQRNLLFGENGVLAYTRKPDADECIAEAQLSHTMDRFKQAVKQSLAGEEIDLSEKEFELFSAIQNSGTAKVQPLINKDCWNCHINIDKAFEGVRKKEKLDTLRELRDIWTYEQAEGSAVMAIRLDKWIKYCRKAGITDDWWELREE